MSDTSRQLAEHLRRIAAIALTRGLALRREERVEIEQALALAEQALDGEAPDPVSALLQWCGERGLEVLRDDMVRREVAAALIGVTIGCLDNWRCARTGLPYVREGRRVYYKLADVAEFIRVHRRVVDYGV